MPWPSRSDRTNGVTTDRKVRRALLAACLVVVSGCARAVLPSEKAFLADPIMQFDEDDLETAADEHVASNREGAFGGQGAGGGGCGCN